MDIFTTALTRIRPSRIKPEKLKVKALSKEPNTPELTDDPNHLEDHNLYFIGQSNNEPDEKNKHTQRSLEENAQHIQSDLCEDNIVPSENVITDKQEILHPEKFSKNNSQATHAHSNKSAFENTDDDESKHLDLYI